jgi:hypothetical protein
MKEELRPYVGEDYDFESNLVSKWAGLRPLVLPTGNEVEEEYKRLAENW